MASLAQRPSRSRSRPSTSLRSHTRALFCILLHTLNTRTARSRIISQTYARTSCRSSEKREGKQIMPNATHMVFLAFGYEITLIAFRVIVISWLKFTKDINPRHTESTRAQIRQFACAQAGARQVHHPVPQRPRPREFHLRCELLFSMHESS